MLNVDGNNSVHIMYFQMKKQVKTYILVYVCSFSFL